MASLRVTNNENEAPADAGNLRVVKQQQNARGLGGVDKRPRYLTSKGAPSTATAATLTRRVGLGERRTALGERRSALADVTNRISVKKSSTVQSMNTTSALAKKKLLANKRAHVATSNSLRDLPPTTPVVNTLGSLGLKDKTPRLSSSPKKEEAKSIQQEHDIDSADKHDPTQCWQYAEDITKYHLSVEKTRQPDQAYMTLQTDINSKMRAILIDWLVDVHYKYALLPQTLHIAILLIDRYLEKNKALKRQKLQLVGITAMFVASKYEEIYPPEAMDFVKITDNAYSKDELFQMERELLAGIEYRVTFPTSYQFMKRFVKASKPKDDRVEHFAHYVIDRTLQEIRMLKYAPSLIAASAVHMAKTQMDELPAWSATLEYHSTYSESKLRECMDDLKEMLWNGHNGVGKSSKLSAVRRKFSKERFMSVGTLPLAFGDAN